MKKLLNYLNLSISQFFRKPEVRREVCAIAEACGGGGGGSTTPVNGLSNLEGGMGFGGQLTEEYTELTDLNTNAIFYFEQEENGDQELEISTEHANLYRTNTEHRSRDDYARITNRVSRESDGFGVEFELDTDDGATIYDDIYQRGLGDADDYSENKTQYSYVTKKMLEETAGSYTFANGLRNDAGVVKLGLDLIAPYTNGVLTEDLFLLKGDVSTQYIKGLQISDIDITGITTLLPIGEASNTGSTLRSGVSGAGVTSDLTVFYDRVQVGTSGFTGYYKGMQYNDDYSTNYTDRSLVDKAYVDNHIPTTPNFIVTTNDEQDLIPGAYYTNNTTQNGIWNLPIVAGSEGKRIGLINQNTGTVTVNGNIYYNGAPVSTLEVMQGETYILYDNGNFWTVIA